MKSWFHRTFICGHWYSGQIKADKRNNVRENRRHYRECQKCGKRVYID